MQKMPKKTMTRTAVTILAAIVALFAAMTANAGQTYILKSGYKVDVPKGFNKMDDKDVEVKFANKRCASFCIESFYIGNFKKDITIESIGKEIEKGIKSEINTMKLISSGVEDLGNHKAYVIEGIIYGKHNVPFIVYGIKFKDYIFKITCGGPAEDSAKNKATFRSIAKSIGKKK